MNLSRFVIGILPTILSCLNLVQLVAPFCHSPLHYSHTTALKLSAASQIVEEEQKSFEDLMDEAVLLYSVTSRRDRFDDTTQAERDILKLRGDELSKVIEDAVFDARGVVRDGLTIIENNADETPTEPETLSQISQALDEQILLGYEATFTEDELEKWIAGIESLQQKLEIQLKALPPGSDWVTEIPEAPKPKPPTPLEKIHDRLETMRTLIDPEGRDRLRPPLAKVISAPSLQHNVVDAKLNTVTDKSINNETEEEKTSKLDFENALIESMNKAAASRVRNVANDTTGIENAEKSGDGDFIEAQVVLPVTSTEPMTATEVILESESPPVNATEVEKDKSKELQLENAMIESMNTAAEKDIHTTVEVQNTLIESQNITEGQDLPPGAEHEKGEEFVKPMEGTDVISTVVTAAALGAAAVTKLPIVLTGVALGPVIRDSISYAKGRAKQAARNKKVSESTPKKEKPKAWSAFDAKPNKKAEHKAKSKSDSDEKES